MLIDLEMVISGFVSKVVNDCGDILKKRIKDADKNRKSGAQSIETSIYLVTIDALNEFTKDTYKGQDALYDAAENILKGFKSSKDDNIEAVRTGLKMLGSQVTSNTCKEFLGKLCHEICTNKNDILYKEIVLIQQKQGIEYINRGFYESYQNEKEELKILNDVKEDTQYIKDFISSKEANVAEYHSKVYIENRAKEYADKWDKNVFLNDFNEEDENAGVNIKLRDIYKEVCLPHYIWETNTKQSDKLRNLLTKYIINNNEKKMLLILGQAGIGKSTLITWMMANLVEKGDNIYVYQFASDLKNINWLGDNILCKILKTLRLGYDELENKTLILDGFDEIYVTGDREKILSKLNQELADIKVLKRFSLIITCRENYVYKVNRIECDFITLQTWDDDQIKSFCEIYGEKSTSTVSETKIDRILENKEVFGIPLILYMVLALNIAIEKNASLVDIYDQVFSLDRSSIYDRCIENSRYGQEHRISKIGIKQQIHQISQRIAFWIFENNDDKASISQEDFKKICEDTSEDIQSDVLIGNYFKLIRHCEGMGTDELQFVHRSIYQYFVVLYFFRTIHNLASKEEVAGKLGELLKKGQLSEQILEFIKYKFDSMYMHNLPNIVKHIFQIMLRDGMTYYTKEKHKKVIEQEMNIFSNMLRTVGLWNSDLGSLDDRIITYLQCNKKHKLYLKGITLGFININLEKQTDIDLRGAYLRGADIREAFWGRVDLRGADLTEANLRGISLIGADLRGADLYRADLGKAYLGGADLRGVDLRIVDLRGGYLRGANLKEADLKGANLEGADLEGADLERANLSGTVFDEGQFYLLHKKYDLSNSKVHILQTDRIISYKEYCIRNQQV